MIELVGQILITLGILTIISIVGWLIKRILDRLGVRIDDE